MYDKYVLSAKGLLPNVIFAQRACLVKSKKFIRLLSGKHQVLNFPQHLICIKSPFVNRPIIKKSQMTKYLVNSDIHKHDKCTVPLPWAPGASCYSAQAERSQIKPGDQLMVMEVGKVLA